MNKKTWTIISLLVLIIGLFSYILFVSNNEEQIVSISLNKNKIDLLIGDKEKLEVIFSPIDYDNKNIKWSSINPNIVSVDEFGNIIALSPGTTIISVETSDNTKKAVCEVTVIDPVTPTPLPTIEPTIKPTVTPIEVMAIKLNKDQVTLLRNQSEVLVATINPINANNQSVSWVSSNPSVVTVDTSGRITAHSDGNATITVTSINGVKSTCKVKVLTLKVFDQRNDAVIEYLKSPTANKIRSVYNSFECSNKSCDKPKEYKTSLLGKINVYRFDTKTNQKTLIVMVDTKDLNYFLIPNNTYYLEEVNDINKVEIVTITGSLRMINALGNFRDLGGWKADNGTIKYGVLFRSATTNGLTSLTVFNLLGISRVVDLRPDSEIDSSSVVESIRRRISITYYSTESNVRNAVETIMKSVVEEDKNVLFNCNFGRDRTGTIAYLLEGILGVGVEDRKTDFELTYLYSPKRTRDDGSLKSLINQINKYNSTSYEQEKFINWYLSTGKDKEKDLKLINLFRKKVIDGNPHEYKLVNDTLTLVS